MVADFMRYIRRIYASDGIILVVASDHPRIPDIASKQPATAERRHLLMFFEPEFLFHGRVFGPAGFERAFRHIDHVFRDYL
jgi:hypothetical protein